MNQKRNKIIYLAATGLLSALMLMSAGMYVFNHEVVAETFGKLGYPSYLVYPLALAKFLGLMAIWSKKYESLKEWAYAGFFFDFVLALAAHLSVNNGEFAPALIATVLLFVSYLFDKKLA
ncbi:DoxX family protein [uncultured Arcticibacterium sp.]|uniref:DoxX family protein n=1 Tax=uncultured Arcticibacterium sp. TaxID=2173042 RepID=UPI0030F8367F